MTPAPDALTLVLAAAGGYAAGSLPSGLLFSRLARGGDIREFGSGATGATNVLRVHGGFLAAAVLAADLIKGALAAGVASYAAGPWPAAAAGAAAVVGHVWPAWIGFRGGKGVATAAGAAAVLTPWAAGAAALGFAAAAAVSRRASVASLAAAATLAGVALARSSAPGIAFAAGAAAVVVVAHRENIRRLVRGEEPRVGRYAPRQRRSDDPR